MTLKVKYLKRLILLTIIITITIKITVSPSYIPKYNEHNGSSLTIADESFPLDIGPVNFTLIVNESVITRGIDDLHITMLLFSSNGSAIGGDTKIYYNISNSDGQNIYSNSFIANYTTKYNVTVLKKVFYNRKADNYTVSALANGSNFASMIRYKEFRLNVLPRGHVEMIFEESKIALKKDVVTEVSFELINVGGSTVSNVTISPYIDREGTRETPIIFLPNINLTLSSGESYYGLLGFFADRPLYQIHTYLVSYTNLDSPNKPIYILSDPLYLICYPNITISNVVLPINGTVGKSYTIKYEMMNYEITPIVIKNIINCPLIPFDNVNNASYTVISGTKPIEFQYDSKPTKDGDTTIDLTIQIEWTTQSGIKWYTFFYYSGIYHIHISPSTRTIQPFSPIVTLSIILISIFISVGYFSRDVIKGLIKYGTEIKEKSFPDVNYPFDVVVVDGSNVAWEEKDSNGHPKLANVEAMINKLSRANFKKILTVADAALRYQIDNQRRLDLLVKEGAIKMLPARVDGDKFILRIAEEENAMIVSNDLFKEFRDIAPWIDERRIPFTILDGEVFLHPTAEKPTDTNNKNKQGTNNAFES